MADRRMLVIEWKHLYVEGSTCKRCAGTIHEIHRAVEGLQSEGKLRGITVRIRDTPLTAERIDESNAILINGISIAAIRGGTVRETSCPSCSALTGQLTVAGRSTSTGPNTRWCRHPRFDARSRSSLRKVAE